MQVSLIDYTGCGSADPARHAANVLLFTKSTRLNMLPGLFEEIANWSDSKVQEELEYMANTIPSSWEFVDYKFLITGVSRGFTHQFVRTRTASYAQQTMRVLDVSGWEYLTGPTILRDQERESLCDEDRPADAGEAARLYHDTMATIAAAYDEMVAGGIAIEDARGVLPTNILTNICAKFDLRAMADTARKRASTRTQGEYRDVMDAMKKEVLRVHPWASLFFNRTFDTAAAELEFQVNYLCSQFGIDQGNRIALIKLIDQMRATV